MALRVLVAIAAAIAAPLTASAQPVTEPPPASGDVPPETLEPRTEPVPPPSSPVPPPPPPPPPPAAEPAVDEPDDDVERPEGFSVGIGLGYDLPTDLSLPDTTTVRFRLASGLTFEPFVVLGASGTSFEFDAGDESSDSSSQVGLGTNVRIPVVTHGPVDFLLVAGARVDFTSNDPDGDDNESSTIATSLLWGLGLEYWVGRHAVLSLTALNPLVSYSSITEANFDGDATQTSWSAGAIFRPDVLLLAHLFL